MKKIIGILLSVSFVVACGKKDEKSKPDFNSWKGSVITERKNGDKVIPTASVLNCRKVQEFSENVHYYYSVIANPESIKTLTTEANVKETSYSQAEFSIEYYSANPEGNNTINKGIFSVDVDFKIIEMDGGQGDKAAIITANKLTIARIKGLYSNNPFFNSLKEGDEIMMIVEPADGQFKSTKLNGTKVDLPGLTKGEKLECR